MAGATRGAARSESVEEREQDGLKVRIVRSERRRKTISGRLLNWRTLEVRAPNHIPASELDQAVQVLVERMLARRDRQRHYRSDEDLQARAERLNQRYLGGAAAWQSIRFVSNQNSRFGSCTPARGTIRIADRLAQVPEFVLDYVILHEMVHLLEPGHTASFWDIVYRYEKAERARGYLMALSLEEDLDSE